METHKGIRQLIGELPRNILLIKVRGDRIIDVQQRHRVTGNAQTNILGQGAVDIHLTGDRNPPAHKTGVHIARLKAERFRERGPAFVGKGHILPRPLMCLRPVQQCQLKLRHTAAHIGVVPSRPHLFFHIGNDIGNPGIIRVRLVGYQQVQLAVLLNLHADFVQPFNRRVAGKEILGPGAKGDDFQIGKPNQGAGNGNKLPNHLCHILCCPHRVRRDIAFQMPHSQIVGAVQHPAVGVAPPVDEVLSALLRSGGEHARAVKMFGNQGFRRLRTEIAQKHHKRIAPGVFHFLHGLQHVLLVFHRGLAFVDFRTGSLAGGNDGGPAALRQRDDETVPRDSDDAQLDLGDIAS